MRKEFAEGKIKDVEKIISDSKAHKLECEENIEEGEVILKAFKDKLNSL